MKMVLGDMNIGFVSEMLRSVCCDAPILMTSDFTCDQENVHCGQCHTLIGQPTGEDYLDLYRDRIPRWYKGEYVRRMMEQLTRNMYAASQALRVKEAMRRTAEGLTKFFQQADILSADQTLVVDERPLQATAKGNADHLTEVARWLEAEDEKREHPRD